MRKECNCFLKIVIDDDFFTESGKELQIMGPEMAACLCLIFVDLSG